MGPEPSSTGRANTRHPGRGSRAAGRLEILRKALWNRLKGGARRPPLEPQRVLIAHHLLLGDTLMLTALLAKLREQYPEAEVVMAVPEALAPLYQGRPYGVLAQPWNPRQPLASPLFAGTGFDLALIPGDNRFSWLAQALGARWIVAFAGDRPAYKSWPVDQLLPYAEVPAAWADMMAGLVPGAAPRPYAPSAWPAPTAWPFARPPGRFVVLHVGASTALKRWPPTCWWILARQIEAAGLVPVWSAGRGEESLVAAADPEGRFQSYAGRLDLAQMWHLIGGAQALISPDTGVAHLGRIVGTPTVTLFGPGSAVLCGAGAFWRDSKYLAVWVDPFPCRDQQQLFKRAIPWVRRCARTTGECPRPLCLEAIAPDRVRAALGELGVLNI
ncbi:hypothetical protein BURK2_01901 [Burkholderiales bacterium]|nr:MAG: glycosyltransferase family 9 protein [Burkholderiales bacterium]CAG0982074.1 hypothetical protein BURK2_01901 [Burkholderiales bacterium]